MDASPYIHFNGNAEEAMTFYHSVLGGELGQINRYRGSPAESMAPNGDLDKVMHMRLHAAGITLMASDVSVEQYNAPSGISLSLQIEDFKDAKRIFDALAENGTVTMALEPTFWSPGFAMVTDRFGLPWMINVTGDPA